ncbi:TPA: hypothetical protein OUB92_003170 [Morganella morganii]|nr:hypothetical protein [Morganella morganii]HDS7241007.1 hypothetical protein [Morganella morganii subsp. morganii]HEI8515180.1 hypothetical protein [Morganella morganii]
MTTENEKSSQVVVVDPADMTGIELYDHLSKRFYPLVRFHQSAGFVNTYVRQLENQVAETLYAAIPALEVASQYPESSLQKDLSLNYRKLLALQDFLSSFEPFPEVKPR